jgi:ABC-type multidrug transport system fused ATPase/permease subunit
MAYTPAARAEETFQQPGREEEKFQLLDEENNSEWSADPKSQSIREWQEPQCEEQLAQVPCPEGEASLFSRITFRWLDDLLERGKKKPLDLPDLWALPKVDDPGSISARFRAAWDRRCATEPSASQNTRSATGVLGFLTNSLFGHRQQRVTAADDDDEQTDSQTLLSATPHLQHSEMNALPASSPNRDRDTAAYAPGLSSLVLALVDAFGWRCFGSAPLKLCYDLLNFVGPLALERMLSFLARDANQPTSNGIGEGLVYALALFLAPVLQSVCLHQYFHLNYRVGLQARAALMAAIYGKTLRLTVASRNQHSSGEMVNLLAVDTQRATVDLTPYLHILWSGPLQITIAMLCLYRVVGIAAFAGFLFMAALIPVNAWLARLIGRQSRVLMERKDERIRLLNEVLTGIRQIKIMGWERAFFERIQEARRREAAVLRRKQLLEAFSNFSWSAAPVATALVTFGFMGLDAPNQRLTPATAFSALTLFNILRFPLSVFPDVISSLMDARVSLGRIQAFLCHHEVPRRSSSGTGMMSDRRDTEKLGLDLYQRQQHEKHPERGNEDAVIIRESRDSWTGTSQTPLVPKDMTTSISAKDEARGQQEWRTEHTTANAIDVSECSAKNCPPWATPSNHVEDRGAADKLSDATGAQSAEVTSTSCIPAYTKEWVSDGSPRGLSPQSADVVISIRHMSYAFEPARWMLDPVVLPLGGCSPIIEVGAEPDSSLANASAKSPGEIARHPMLRNSDLRPPHALQTTMPALSDEVVVPLDCIPAQVSHPPMSSPESVAAATETKACRKQPHVQETLTAGKASRCILHDITLQILQGQLVIISGEVGSGKSSLLQAILGEMYAVPSILPSGTLPGSGRPARDLEQLEDLSHHLVRAQIIGYCPQEPYIINASLRDNILFHTPMDEARYQEVLKATALIDDLAQMPDGDMTEIGSKGINLSGGQKARVALARALYSEAALLLLDDPLSAVDASVGRILFEGAICGPLGRGRTRILVTHHLQWLNRADLSVELEAGHIKRLRHQTHPLPIRTSLSENHRLSGNISIITEDTATDASIDDARACRSAGQAVSSITTATLEEHKSVHGYDGRSSWEEASGQVPLSMQVPETDVAAKRNVILRDNLQQAPMPETPTRHLIKSNVPTKPTQSSTEKLNPAGGTENKKGADPKQRSRLVTLEQRETGSVKRGVYKAYFAAAGRALLSITLVAAVLAQAFRIATDSWLGLWSDASEHSLPRNVERVGTVLETKASPDMAWWAQKRHTASLDAASAVSIEPRQRPASSRGEDCSPGSGSDTWHASINERAGCQPGLSHQEQRTSVISGTFPAERIVFRPEFPQAKQQPKPRSMHFYLLIYALLNASTLIMLLLRAVLAALSFLAAAIHLHTRLVRLVLRAPTVFFDTTPVGRILNRFSKDQDALDEDLPYALLSFLNCILQVLGVVWVTSTVTPIMLLVLLPIGLLYYRLSRYYLSTSRELKRLEAMSKSPLLARMGETVAGIPVIRAFDLVDAHIRAFLEALADNMRPYLYSVACNRWLSFRLELFSALTVFATALAALLFRRTINAAAAGLSITYSLMVTQTLSWLIRMTTEVENGMSAVERMLWEIPSEARDYIPGSIPEHWPSRGQVVFRDVWMRYRAGLAPALKGVSFRIEPGQRVGLVGRTGAGKSSIAQVLFRTAGDPLQAGSIQVDGIDIGQVGVAQLRERLAMVTQDNIFFMGTIRDNLDPFHRYADATLWRALSQVHLVDHRAEMAAQHVVDMKDSAETHQSGAGPPRPPASVAVNSSASYRITSLDALVAEAGANLSAGQRQLLCLARVLLRQPRVLVLDESTANLDYETDQAVQQTIRACLRETTLLIIAHRIGTVLDCDLIIGLADGRVVETGPPSELLARPDSLFRRLAQEQGQWGKHLEQVADTEDAMPTTSDHAPADSSLGSRNDLV